MPNFATTLSVLLAVLVGATIVLLRNYVEDRLRGVTARTGFPDVLVPGDGVKYSDFVWIALPPITGVNFIREWVRIRAQVNGLKPEVVIHEASSPQPRDDV